MTRARSALIDPGATPYYHCMARCVRRAYLCGEDHLTGKSYEHRRQWVVDRLRALVSILSIYPSTQKRVERLSDCGTGKQSGNLMPFRLQGQNPELALLYRLHDYLELVD